MKLTSCKASGEVRVGIVGTGGMANVHAERFHAITGCRLTAACDVVPGRAREFAGRHGIPAAFESVEAMLSGADVDAVSVVTPDRFHAPVSLACLRAGKHVLCEKPLALDAAEAAKMRRAAEKARVVNMVNFSYRNWPAIQEVRKLVGSGGLGDVRHVEASYLQAWLVSKAWGDWRTSPAWLWRLSKAHGSQGVLGDVGVHILDFATFPCGPVREVSCKLKTFPKVRGNRIGEYRLDANDSAAITVEFANGALGIIHTTRWCGGHNNRLFLKIAGTLGTVEIDSDVAIDAYRACMGQDLDSATWRTVACKPVPDIYRRFINAIRQGGSYEPDFARGEEVQRMLDACFQSDASRAPLRLRAR